MLWAEYATHRAISNAVDYMLATDALLDVAANFQLFEQLHELCFAQRTDMREQQPVECDTMLRLVDFFDDVSDYVLERRRANCSQRSWHHFFCSVEDG